MRDTLAQVKNQLVESKIDECMVKGCDSDAKSVELLAFDPIDHNDKTLALCDQHSDWAERRNDLAQTIRVELREARAEIGRRYADEVQELQRTDFEISRDSVDISQEDVERELERL